MNKKSSFLIVLALLTCFTNSIAQVKAYQIFTKDGKKASFESMAKSVGNNQVILFGEFHNNPISHWLQVELVKYLHSKKKKLKFGAEMFERDEQVFLNQYKEGLINQAKFDSLSGGLWKNFSTDYRPLVDFASKNGIDFWATNIPRRFASLVYKGGFEALDTLSTQQKEWIAKLPIKYDPSLSAYANIGKMVGGHASVNLAKSQAIKDATMAETIIRYYLPTGTYVHFHGTYHSNHYQGIYWYLKQEIPGMTIATIATATQADLKKLSSDNIGLADFIIVVDEDMTTTY